MAIDDEFYKKSIEALDEALKNMTQEDINKYFPKEEPLPTGWLDIEEHLPIVTCQDFIDNNAICKVIKVKDKDGNEFLSAVGDHNVWYYLAKESGITHWYNQPDKQKA